MESQKTCVRQTKLGCVVVTNKSRVSVALNCTDSLLSLYIGAKCRKWGTRMFHITIIWLWLTRQPKDATTFSINMGIRTVEKKSNRCNYILSRTNPSSSSKTYWLPLLWPYDPILKRDKEKTVVLPITWKKGGIS